ncbi:hypothetical protein shim_20790 [Shimia sp. SK013]|uniref:hypothetical protein n=1 Tax=Shimia sp. SK013 TaxID=1389006 RepID=UPI0006B4B95F|nr:hypothetical protein [Shimia sp. SK013]KPA21375.1 hypothetical protein shim_20790 [Shimia sp. SK013]
MITRRAFILAGLATPLAAAAHDGHSHLPVTVAAEGRIVRGGGVVVTLTTFNSTHAPVTLSGVAVQGAEVTAFAPVLVAPGSVNEAEIHLGFQGDVPKSFFITLDFGDQGNGPVAVVM